MSVCGLQKYSTAQPSSILIKIRNVCLFIYLFIISILEWFLKDHVTLKTGVMDIENSIFIFLSIKYSLGEASFKNMKKCKTTDPEIINGT